MDEDVEKFVPTLDDQIAVLSEALETAEDLDSQLHSTYVTFEKLLTECAATRTKLRERRVYLENRIKSCKRQRDSRTFYSSSGRPYFRDKSNYPCPYNEDAIRLQRSRIPDFYKFRRSMPWTNGEKDKLLQFMLKLSREKKIEEITAKYNSISQYVSSDLNKFDAETIQEQENLKHLLDDVYDAPLESVALPLDRLDEYNWIEIANESQVKRSDRECRAVWKVVLHPSINKGLWSKKEINRLTNLAKEYEARNWDYIAEKLGTNRSPYQCFIYYKNFIYKSLSKGTNWTKEEDAFLEHIIENLRIGDYIPWAKVSAYIDKRSKTQVYNRYLRLKGNIYKSGSFDKEEDNVIIAAMKLYGRNTRKIVQCLPGRSIAQVSYRIGILVNAKTILWSLSEDSYLLKLIGDQLPDYEEISKHFIGKSHANVRRRYLLLTRWLRANPLKTLRDFPRQATSNPLSNLDTAMKRLRNSIENNPKIIRTNLIFRRPLSGIDRQILSYFKNLPDKNTIINQSARLPMMAADVCEVRAILQLLGANLNMSKVASLQSQAPEIANLAKCLLTESKTLDAPVKKTAIKTYSRKKVPDTASVDNLKTNKSVDIWKNDDKIIRYYLPPFNDTITALRSLSLFRYTKRQTLNMNFTIMPSSSCVSQNNMWTGRVAAMFFMTNLLATLHPYVKSKLFHEDQAQISSRTVTDDLLLNLNLNIYKETDKPYLVASRKNYYSRKNTYSLSKRASPNEK